MLVIHYRSQRSWGKVIFSEACVNNSVHRGGMHGCTRGACVVLFGWACVVLFRGACMVLFGGACMVLFGGHAWFYSGACMVLFRGACMVLFGGGMCGFIQGGCVVFSVFFGYNVIRSMSRAVHILLECILVF